MQTTTTYDEYLLENLLTERQYAEALQYIDSLNIKKNRDLSREDIARLYFAQGQCFYRLGDYRKAAVKVKCSIKIANPLNDNLLYARQKYTLGQIYFEIGRLDEALEEFSEASAFFRRVNDTPRLLAAQEMIALIHFHKGNYAQACVLNETLLSQVKRLGLGEHVKVVTFNLCRVLMLTGDLKRVSELLDSIADDCTDLLSLTWLESLRGMLCVRLLDDAGANEHLGTAIARARECRYRRDEIVCLEYLALNDFYHGRHAEAIGYCEQILATPEVTPSAVAQTLWLLTEVYVAENKLIPATETGAKAEQSITQVKEWAELGCLHRAMALLSDKRGNLQGTTRHFDKAIEILSRHGARYELAVTYLTMGQTRCLAIDFKKEKLQQAKTLFMEMDVPKRVAQVEEAIVGLTSIKPQPKILRNINSSIETPGIITQNPEMQRILAEARRFAATDMTVLITGETGTGKDLLAQYIHCHSRRAAGPFRNENMARFTDSLIETELFGYEKGSHSRAERNKPGLIESAHDGTFCLNEVAELSMEMQAHLLQLIETGTIRRVGGRELRSVDVRFIAITNKSLSTLAANGRFRADLYHRLHRGHLHIPPLRERKDDLPLLLEFFLQRLKSEEYCLRQAVMIVEKCGLDRYDWPGNVRELENLIGRAVALSPLPNVPGLICSLGNIMTQQAKVHDGEHKRLLATLKRNQGNISATARELGVHEATLRYRLKRCGD